MLEREVLKRIINDCLDGKKESFAKIVEAFQKKIFNFCFYYLGSTQDAEDATMEIFLRIFKNLSFFNPNLDFSAWVFTIAKNYLKDIAKRKKVEREYIFSHDKDSLEISKDSPEEIVIREAEKENLRKALLNLQEKYRAVLIFKYYMDLSYDEISKIMGIPRNTVASMIFRGKEELKKIFDKGVRK